MQKTKQKRNLIGHDLLQQKLDCVITDPCLILLASVQMVTHLQSEGTSIDINRVP